MAMSSHFVGVAGNRVSPVSRNRGTTIAGNTAFGQVAMWRARGSGSLWVTELRGVPKERMTGTRSTEGVITRSGTALHRHLRRRREINASSGGRSRPSQSWPAKAGHDWLRYRSHRMSLFLGVAKRLAWMRANLLHWLSGFVPGRRAPETRKSRFPERKEVGLPSFSRASHGRTQGPPGIEAAKGSAFLQTPQTLNPEIRKSRFPESVGTRSLADFDRRRRTCAVSQGTSRAC